ncbi:MAG: hypothetical protein JXR73_11760 [Candidatus Omnitrophica bacterium]|nr:hypothetical protein [Candidatus Omnitrophota bacterium]
MLRRNGFIFALFAALVLGNVSPRGFAQEPLALDQEIFDSLPLYGSALQYSLQLEQGTYLEAILYIEERDFALEFSLLDGNTRQVVWSNASMNYPNFQGAYLFTEIPSSGEYILDIYVSPGFSQRVDFALVARAYEGDEPDPRAIALYDLLEGVIGPEQDYDMFTISLRQGTPVLFVAVTPNSILDSVMGVIDPNGELLGYNDDFFGTGSTLFFDPEITGEYQIFIQGAYVDSIGPYRLLVNPAPLYNSPFTKDDEIADPGEMRVYQTPLQSDQVYDFMAVGVDDFYPILALTDAEMNVIAAGQATEDFQAALIEGFTPVNDETLYLYVMGSTTEDAGAFGLESTLREDDEDGTLLSPGDAYKGVIGPAGDIDEYRFIAAEGETYSILATPTEHYLDPAVRVLDENGVELFFNDDSADGVFSMLSGITLPKAGEYRIEVTASPSQLHEQRLTGVYIIQFATGTTFDWGAPHIAEDEILLSPTASGVHITIPTAAIADDTYPLAATLTIDLTGQDISFSIQKDEPVELDLEADAEGVFFLTLTDSAAKSNITGPAAIPGPRIIADLEGMPTALAVDRVNNLYAADSQLGGIVKYHIGGASEVILSGEQTQGGTLGPNALAFDPDGTLFYANAATHSIVKALPGGATETFVSELNFPLSFTFDKDGVMYLAQIGSDTIDKIYPNGIIEPYAGGIRNPSGLAFSPDGALYACNSAVGESGIYRIDENGDSSVFIEPFSDSLSGMAFDRDGNLYVTDENSGVLYRFNPEGEFILFAHDIGATAGLAFGHGEYAKTLFVCSGHNYEDPYRTPFIYEQKIIAIPTGRVGIPVPDMETSVAGWLMF